MDSEQIGFLVLAIIVVGQIAYRIYRGSREGRSDQWDPFDGWDS